MKKINLKKVGKIVPIIGVILFIYIIYNIGIEKIVHSFALIPIYYYPIAFLPFLLRVVITAYKWQYVSKKQKMNFSLTYLIKIVFISIYYGNITPGGFGWYIRTFYLRKKSNASIEKCITNSLIEGATGNIVGLFLGIIGAYLLIAYSPVYTGLFYILVAFFIFQVVTLVVFIEKSGGSKIVNIFIRPIIPRKYKEKLDRSLNSFYEDIPKLRDMIVPMLTDLAVWIIVGVQVYIIALAFSINVSLPMFLLLHTISVIAAGIVPITVAGLGVREGMLVFLLIPFGVEAQTAFVISFSGFIIKVLVPAIAGMVFSFKEK